MTEETLSSKKAGNFYWAKDVKETLKDFSDDLDKPFIKVGDIFRLLKKHFGEELV